MTDHVPASASFDAPAGQAEPSSAVSAPEVIPPGNTLATPPAVHSVPADAGPKEAREALSQALPGEAEEEPPPQSFAEMGLSQRVVQSLTEMGFREPMPVQRRTYRPLMAGRDVIVQSRTGSGKTAAFGIPFVQGLVDESVDCKDGRIQALVLGPTRELALQVGAEVTKIAANTRVSVASVYGGAPMGKQVDALKAGSHIVAGTPGRVLDHLRRGTLQLGGLRVVVLDEADEMLSMGFQEDIIEILRRCPENRQTLLFSATMPDEVVRLAQRFLRSPLMLQLSADFVGVSEIAHAYYMVSGMGRNRDLLRVLQIERPDSAMIFCNTREETGQVAEFLRSQGLDAEPISSDLTQAERERVMGRMKKKNLHYLVATDVAARGIDISDLSHVLNYTFPESAEVYIHRTGRTGRAGKAGVAISLISPRELGNFYYLKLTYKIRPEERTLPSEAELQTLREGQYLDRLLQEFAERKPAAEFRGLLKRVMASEESERVLALLLEQYLTRPILAASESAHAAGHSSSHASSHRDAASHHGESIRRGRPRDDEAPVGMHRERERRPSREREAAPAEHDSRRRGLGRERSDEAADDSRGRRRSSLPRRRDEGSPAAPPAAPQASMSEAAAKIDGEPVSARRGGASENSRPLERRSRPAGPEAAPPVKAALPAPEPATVPAAAAASSADDIIHVEDGRDFWEAWVDARKVTGGEPAAPPETAAKGAAEAGADADGEDGDRRGRRRRSGHSPTVGEVRLYLNLGRRDRVTDEALAEFLAQRGISRYPLELYSTHAYLYVPEVQAEPVIAALNGATHGQRTVLCERARR
jgi:ATP-dependent RNA helicase DeaD